jgi:hypothetical protein
MKISTTAVVLSVSPAASLFLASQFRCRGQEVAPWAAVLLAITTGIAAYEIGNEGESDTIALMYTLNFMLGSGWLLTSRFCSRPARAAHAVVTLVVVVSLMNRLRKKAALYFLIPLLVQVSYMSITAAADAAHLVDKSFVY